MLKNTLSLLIGKWRGEGKGGFPTIDSFIYQKELIFEPAGTGNVIHFDQRTWHITPESPRSRPIHFQSGFIRLLENDERELVNSQNNGRVEVMWGRMIPAGDNELHLFFESTAYNNDPRMIKSTRELRVTNDKLSYIFDMATNNVPEIQRHLEADLKKIIR